MACNGKRKKNRGRLFSLLLAMLMVGFILPVKAEEEPVDVKQNIRVKNSYLNITSVNKKKDAKVQDVVIDKCFLSIIRINLGDKEVPVEIKE